MEEGPPTGALKSNSISFDLRTRAVVSSDAGVLFLRRRQPHSSLPLQLKTVSPLAPFSLLSLWMGTPTRTEGREEPELFQVYLRMQATSLKNGIITSQFVQISHGSHANKISLELGETWRHYVNVWNFLPDVVAQMRGLKMPGGRRTDGRTDVSLIG